MINIFQPNINKESQELLQEVFNSNWLGRGKFTQIFEEEFASFLTADKENVHTVASCSDAIFACLQIFDLPKGSHVVIPSISFPAIPSAILEAGLIPRIIDIDTKTGNIDLDQLISSLDCSCSAIFLTDYGGIPVEINKIRKSIDSDIKIFLDTAASLGTFVDKKFSGSEADFCCWSFDAMKLLTCGEGGGVFIKDKGVMKKFREYMYLGLESSSKSGLDKTKEGKNWWEYQLNRIGRRSVFTDINAAIGLPQIKNLKAKLLRRQEIREAYINAFESVDGLDYIRQDNPTVSYSNYFFSLSLTDRDDLAAFLIENSIYSTFRYYPLHLIDLFKPFSNPCPAADEFSSKTLNIPIHNSLEDSDIEKIIEYILDFKK